jgi:hypothetical protein
LEIDVFNPSDSPASFGPRHTLDADTIARLHEGTDWRKEYRVSVGEALRNGERGWSVAVVAAVFVIAFGLAVFL